MPEYRASFDDVVRFSNGGDLTVHGFRVDVPSPNVDDAGIAALFVASLGLLMTDDVEVANVEVFAEPHKGTRGGSSDHRAPAPVTGGRFVELNHVIATGAATLAGTYLDAGRDVSGLTLAATVDLPAVAAGDR
jgi:hypothetical protein